MVRQSPITPRIIQLYSEGYPIVQIAKELNINHAQVSRVIKKNFPGAQPPRRKLHEVKIEKAKKLQEMEKKKELQGLLNQLQKEQEVTSDYLQTMV